MKYRGLEIKESQDFGLRQRGLIGYVITDGFCNVMPGCTYAMTPSQARQLINVYFLGL